MALKIKGIDATLSTFREIDRRFTEEAGAAVEKGAKDIAALARKYAPIDKGDLERSIRAQRVNDGRSTKWRVKVGGTQGGRNVSEYALAAHEGFSTNRKSWSLGKKSKAKAAALGVPVGPGYLRRAFTQLSPSISKAISEGLRAETQRLARRSRSNRR